MKLNLIHEEKSDIKYKIDRFPDGEPTFEILSDLGQHVDDVEILTRIAGVTDVFILLLVCDILDRWEIKYSIEITYLMTQRMDRVMNMNRPFSLKVMNQLLSIPNINSDYLYIHELHSHVMYEMYRTKNHKHLHSSGMSRLIDFMNTKNIIDATIVFPDKGASKRYSETLYGCEKLYFEKVRNLESGAIVDITPVNDPTFINNKKHFIVIDDLCDGGSTFIKIKEYLTNTFGGDIKVDIVVYHIVNHKGIECLLKNFDNVYTTNSYLDWNKLYSSEKLHILEVV